MGMWKVRRREVGGWNVGSVEMVESYWRDFTFLTATTSMETSSLHSLRLFERNSWLAYRLLSWMILGCSMIHNFPSNRYSVCVQNPDQMLLPEILHN